MFRTYVEWRRRSRQIKAIAAKLKAERLEDEAAARRRALAVTQDGARPLPEATGKGESGGIMPAARVAPDRKSEFQDFVDGEPFRQWDARLPGATWVHQVSLMLYLFAVLLAFLIGILYSPAITVAVTVIVGFIVLLWPAWGVTLSILVVSVALIGIL